MLSLKALEKAKTQIGQSEVPKNSNFGGMVTEYLKSVGISFPAAWCMAFVYWCFEEASKELAIKNPLVKTGGVMYHFVNAKKAGALRFITLKKNVKIADIMIMDFGNGKGHTGIVTSVNGDGTVNVIEGNTNDDGSREGYEVAIRKRKISSILAFLRYS
jgi:hypothetical protein